MTKMTNDNASRIDAEDGLVTASLVPDDQRMGTLPRYFGTRFIGAEALVFRWMSTLCADYTGAFWSFHRLSNGGFFMAPEGEAMTVAVDGNGYEGTMSAEAAGITACLFAFCQLANTSDSEADRFIELYHHLRDFVGFHVQASAIFRAID